MGLRPSTDERASRLRYLDAMAIDMRELGVLRPATACASKWSQMDGDATVRRCAACRQNVYRFCNLDPFAARELLLREERRLCVRFYARPDGTVLTRDCAVGLRRRKLRGVTLAALLVALFAGLGFVVDAGGPEAAARKVLPRSDARGTNDEFHGMPPHDESQCKCMHSFVINTNY